MKLECVLTLRFADEKRSRDRLHIFYCWEVEILGQGDIRTIKSMPDLFSTYYWGLCLHFIWSVCCIIVFSLLSFLSFYMSGLSGNYTDRWSTHHGSNNECITEARFLFL